MLHEGEEPLGARDCVRLFGVCLWGVAPVGPCHNRNTVKLTSVNFLEERIAAKQPHTRNTRHGERNLTQGGG